jgi:ADP-heptose:LPS heptosyltransferase
MIMGGNLGREASQTAAAPHFSDGISDGTSDGIGECVPQVARIAVLRATAIGDVIVTLPALDALRQAYPTAEIVLLGKPATAELLANRPGPVDRVVVVPFCRGIRDPEPPAKEDLDELDAFFEAMQAEQFDLAVQLHGGGRWSNPFVRRLGARVTAGMQAADAPPLDRTIPYELFHHDILRLLEVVALVGASPVTIRPALTVTDADRAAARQVLDPDAAPVVAIHPGATDPRRRWPPERFAAVADTLADLKARVVITGSADDKTLADEVAALMRHPATSLCGRVTLGALAGILERCVLMVGNDTGPRHLAEAVGTATVSVYWCGNLINVGPLGRRRHRAHVSWRLNCPRCGASALADTYPTRDERGCAHRPSFVTDVPVQEVRNDAVELYTTELASRQSTAEARIRSINAVVDSSST